jgi:hypothetical protein
MRQGKRLKSAGGVIARSPVDSGGIPGFVGNLGFNGSAGTCGE